MSIHSELQRLSQDEQIKLVSELWDLIASDPSHLPVSQWHPDELEKCKMDDDDGEDWDVVRDELLVSFS